MLPQTFNSNNKTLVSVLAKTLKAAVEKLLPIFRVHTEADDHKRRAEGTPVSTDEPIISLQELAQIGFSSGITGTFPTSALRLLMLELKRMQWTYYVSNN